MFQNKTIHGFSWLPKDIRNHLRSTENHNNLTFLIKKAKKKIKKASSDEGCCFLICLKYNTASKVNHCTLGKGGAACALQQITMMKPSPTAVNILCSAPNVTHFTLH